MLRSLKNTLSNLLYPIFYNTYYIRFSGELNGDNNKFVYRVFTVSIFTSPVFKVIEIKKELEDVGCINISLDEIRKIT